MAHLLWIDTKLLTQEDENERYKVYRDIQIAFGWTRGQILAELPSWDVIRKIISRRTTGETESLREAAILEKISKDGKSLGLVGTTGTEFETIAQNTPLIDYLLSENPPTKTWCPKYKQVEEYLLNPPQFASDTTWSDPVFMKRIDILAIGSSHIDIIDQYLPLDGPNPLFSHLIKSFGIGGAFRKHLPCRPEIRIHFCERPGEKSMGREAVLSRDETTASLLKRMNASRLNEAFQVVFALWEKGKHHDRKIIGDIGGLHLGRGSAPTSLPFAVTPLPDPKGDRISLELEMQKKRSFYRCLP